MPLPPNEYDQVVNMALPFDRNGRYIKRGDPKRLEIKPVLSSCINIKIPYTSCSSSLEKMKSVAKRLKELNPDDLMPVRDYTIGTFADDPYFEHSKLADMRANRLPLAYYRNNKARIYCNPKTLDDTRVWINHADALALDLMSWKYTALIGDLALILLICHELAHHETYGHAAAWKVKFSKFFWQIINDIRRLQ